MKAANAMQVYKEALSQFEAEMKGSAPTMNWIERFTGDAFGTYAARMAQYREGIYGLASAQIVTGHKKTGLFGWGKGKDLYSSILSVYPETRMANWILRCSRRFSTRVRCRTRRANIWRTSSS